METLEERLQDVSRKLSKETDEGLMVRIKVEPFEEELEELPLHP